MNPRVHCHILGGPLDWLSQKALIVLNCYKGLQLHILGHCNEKFHDGLGVGPRRPRLRRTCRGSSSLQGPLFRASSSGGTAVFSKSLESCVVGFFPNLNSLTKNHDQFLKARPGPSWARYLELCTFFQPSRPSSSCGLSISRTAGTSFFHLGLEVLGAGAFRTDRDASEPERCRLLTS